MKLAEQVLKLIESEPEVALTYKGHPIYTLARDEGDFEAFILKANGALDFRIADTEQQAIDLVKKDIDSGKIK
jgi:hypothetical protein